MLLRVMIGLSILLFSGCTVKRKVVYPESGIKVSAIKAATLSAQQKRRYLAVVNKMRSKSRSCGGFSYYAAAKPLQWNDDLYKAAYEHSLDMARSRKFSHTGSGSKNDHTASVNKLGRGSFLQERIKSNGYSQRIYIGENIAYGRYSLDELMEKWIKSKGHCANIMNPKFTDFAMAKVSIGGKVSYWSQVFASSYKGRRY